MWHKYFHHALRRERQREGVEGAIGLNHIQIFPGCGKFASQDSTRKCEILAWVLPSDWYALLEVWQQFVTGHAQYVRYLSEAMARCVQALRHRICRWPLQHSPHLHEVCCCISTILAAYVMHEASKEEKWQPDTSGSGAECGSYTPFSRSLVA